MNGKIFRLIALLVLLPGALSGQEESLTERKLQQMVRDEKTILRAAKQADGSYDRNVLERRFQQLLHDYDAFIRENPDFAAGYVAYGRLLERVGEEAAARAIYLKANQLDPNIPLVKNQLAKYLAEEGDFAQALPYYLAAIELEPQEPIYHYQLGELLYRFRDDFVRENIFTREVLDQKMLEAFRNAARLAPAETAFAYRHAEAFYDLNTPDWDRALKAWAQLEADAAPGLETETIRLHRANIAIKQGEPEKARQLLRQVQATPLQGNKETLEAKLKALEAREE